MSGVSSTVALASPAAMALKMSGTASMDTTLMSDPGFRPASLITLDRADGHVVIVSVHGTDILAAAFGLDEAFHHFLALGTGEVTRL